MSDDTVCMPVATFESLQEQSANYTPPTTRQRAEGTAQAVIVLSALAAVVPVWGYGWSRTMNWLDKKREERRSGPVTNLTSVQ